MNVQEIIGKTAEILGLDGTVESVKAELLKCLNAVYEELTLTYVRMKKTETVTAGDEGVAYISLSRPVREILTVRQAGRKIPFHAYVTHLAVECEGNVEVTYLYRGQTLSLTDAVELPANFTVYAMALGTTAEYSFRKGLTEEGEFYANRYRRVIAELTGCARERRLSVRRWL